MDKKTKVSGLGKEASPKNSATVLKYETENSVWGLGAFFQGQRLVFSGNFSPSRRRFEQWQKFLPFLKTKKIIGKVEPGENIDVYQLFSIRAKDAWSRAGQSAQKRGGRLGVEDIFLALLKEPGVNSLLTRLKVNTGEAEILLKNYLLLKPADTTLTVKKIPFEAFALSVKLHDHKIGSLMLLGALLIATPQENILQAIFTNIGLTLEKLELFSVWILNLNYNLPQTSPGFKFLYCCRQAESLEEHFGYFFELPAIERAVNLSSGQSLKDLEHKKALQLLVRAANLAKAKNKNVISENFVKQAALSPQD